MKSKQKRKSQPIGDPHVDQLYKAVQNYVEHGGGKLIVIGGIQIQEWPTDHKYVFHVAVRCLGQKPKLDGCDGERPIFLTDKPTAVAAEKVWR